jgi:hypothetical protein
MASRFIKDIPVTDIDMFIRNKHRHFILIYVKKERVLDFNQLKNMTFDTIYNGICDGKLFISKIVETDKKSYARNRPQKPIVEVKVGIKSNCRTTIDDLINAM